MFCVIEKLRTNLNKFASPRRAQSVQFHISVDVDVEFEFINVIIFVIPLNSVKDLFTIASNCYTLNDLERSTTTMCDKTSEPYISFTGSTSKLKFVQMSASGSFCCLLSYQRIELRTKAAF